jgi:hypothetical protein
MPDGESVEKGKSLDRLLKEADLDADAVSELSEILADRKVDARQRWSQPQAVERLQEASRAFHLESEFKVGDVVRWKVDLKNKRNPPYGVPMVVFELLPETVLDGESGSGSQYFREPLNMIVGMYVEGSSEDSIGLYHVDSRRLEHHPDFGSSSS